MDDRFELWVRALCAGAFAIAAWAVYTTRISGLEGWTREALSAWTIEGLLVIAAVAFAVRPERLAYAYRGGAGVPRWSKGLSVTRTDPEPSAAPDESFDAYRPTLAHLASAFLSLMGYAVAFFRAPRSQAEWEAAAVLGGTALVLWYAGRREAARRAGAP